jgi:flagella basal body P-ring formation protein FlgA
MIRIAAVITALIAAAPAIAQSPLPDLTERPALKRSAIVMGEIVRVGDLIDNAGAVAEVAIFRAPDLGQTGSVPAGTVVEAVRAHHIIGLDTRGFSEVTVTRASRPITAKDFEARLIRALAGQYGLGDAKDLVVTFEHEVRTIQVEPTAAGLGIARLNYDPRTRRFDVMFEVTGSAVVRRMPMRFVGSVAETMEVVIPLRAFAVNEVFKSGDVMIERRPKSEFAGAVMPTIEEVLGFAAKRQLRPGQAIRAADLMRPELVARNDNVTIMFEAPGMVLTIRGKALEGGGQGDVIHVQNVQSKRTVQATVSGPGRVFVTSHTPRLAANGARKQTP